MASFPANKLPLGYGSYDSMPHVGKLFLARGTNSGSRTRGTSKGLWVLFWVSVQSRKEGTLKKRHSCKPVDYPAVFSCFYDQHLPFASNEAITTSSCLIFPGDLKTHMEETPTCFLFVTLFEKKQETKRKSCLCLGQARSKARERPASGGLRLPAAPGLDAAERRR